MMIMNLDYYYLFVFCNTLQQASIVSTIRRSFFFFLPGGDSTENRKTYYYTYAHMHTRTHHSWKSISGFFLLFVLLVFWHTTITTTITTTRQCRSLCLFCFNFGLSCCYYYLWPSSDTRELKFKMYQRPITTKKGKGEKFHCMEYFVQKEKKKKTYPHTHHPQHTHHTERNLLRI